MDFPSLYVPNKAVLSSHAADQPLGELGLMTTVNASAAAVWPTANKAFFSPVLVTTQVTVYQMSVIVAVQAGNLDVAILDENANRIVSSGSTAVGAAGAQLLDIADTDLPPGLYFFGMAASSTTASFNRTNHPVAAARTAGMLQQTSALPIANPATFAAVDAAYQPLVVAHLTPTV